jgi:hypothetical protein
MARKKFTLEVDGDGPQGPGQGHVFQGGIPGQNVVDPAEFTDMLAKGLLTTVGYIYQGQFASSLAADTQSGTYAAAAAPLAVKCIVVYVGGTAYKICT